MEKDKIFLVDKVKVKYKKDKEISKLEGVKTKIPLIVDNTLHFQIKKRIPKKPVITLADILINRSRYSKPYKEKIIENKSFFFKLKEKIVYIFLYRNNPVRVFDEEHPNRDWSAPPFFYQG